jgi:carboxypeptidase Q
MRISVLIVLLAFSQILAAEEKTDLGVIHQIKKEAFENSRVMDHLFYLVDVCGPRQTGSPGFQAAADWSVKRLQEWGLANATQEQWGPYGQGWSTSLFSAHLVQPQYETLIGVPLAWSPSTEGLVSGRPLCAPLKRESILKRDEAAIDEFIGKYKGKLKNEILLIAPLKDVKVQATVAHQRFNDAELAERSVAPEPVAPVDYDDPELEIPADPEKRSAFMEHAPAWYQTRLRKERQRIQNRLNQFLIEEGVRLILHPASRGDGGTVFPPRAGSRDPKDIAPPASIAITPEQYNRIYRLSASKVPVHLEVEVRAQFHRETENSINVIAELPGGSQKEEIVMMGAHLDSVSAGLGATDNAAGCAVVMEAARILKSLDLRLNRTVRLALWGGEEEGLLGSKAYVKRHFADPETMTLTPEHARLAAYFNVDNGTGKIRGVYLQDNDMVRPIFRSWLDPFRDLGATTLSIRRTGGTDHLSFDAVGLPGFQFIQDPVEYETRTHHSNMDVYERIQPGDLMQASAIVASFVVQAANRVETLPRKPLPKPQPEVRPEKP